MTKELDSHKINVPARNKTLSSTTARPSFPNNAVSVYKDVMRQVNPLGYRVLVKIKHPDDLSEGGLYLPAGSKESMQESVLAEVMEVAIATDDDTDEEMNVSGVPQGALVLIEKNVGIRVPWDADLRIVETNDVLAIVNEVSLS